MSDGGTLAPLGYMRINQIDEFQLKGKIVEGSDATKLSDAGSQRLSLGILKTFQQGIGSA